MYDEPVRIELNIIFASVHFNAGFNTTFSTRVYIRRLIYTSFKRSRAIYSGTFCAHPFGGVKLFKLLDL